MKKHVMSMNEFLNEDEQSKKFDWDLHKNWGLPHQDKEFIDRNVENNKKSMESLKNRIESDMKKGKSLEKWIWGYVINKGGKGGIDTESVCYGRYPTKKQDTSYVLIDSVGGGLVWAIYSNENVMAGGNDKFRDRGIEIYRIMQDVK